MTRFARQLAREYPVYYQQSSGWGVIVVPLREELVAQIRPALLILMAATGIVPSSDSGSGMDADARYCLVTSPCNRH